MTYVWIALGWFSVAAILGIAFGYAAKTGDRQHGMDD